MTCETCSNWTTLRRRVYDDGSEFIDYSSPEGKGHCEALGIETPAAFHCSSHAAGGAHIRTERIEGHPWAHFKYGPCPDCAGRGSTPEAGMCYRCYGTAKVRFYEDGYIGEERTRLHPKEREALLAVKRLGERLEQENRPCTIESDIVSNIPKPGETLERLPPPDPFAGQGSL